MAVNLKLRKNSYKRQIIRQCVDAEGSYECCTLQFNEKMFTQVKIENSYIYGGKFKIKDKFLKRSNNWTMQEC